MESIITALTTNKLILTIAVIISILIVLSVAKKLVRVALVCVSILILYAAYLVFTGQKVPRTRQEAIQHVTKKIDELRKSEVNVLKQAR
jgi:predicted tellurium resistance membrane protein TerC